MKKVIILTVLSILFSLNCFSQWKWSHPKPQGNRLYLIRYVSPTTAFAVGSYGTILKSDDGGDSWRVTISNTHYEIYDIIFPTASRGYAIGGQILLNSGMPVKRIVLKTDDGGENWYSVFDDYFEPFTGLWFISPQTGFIVASDEAYSYGILRKTTDGGITWNDKWYGFLIDQLVFTDSVTGFMLTFDSVLKSIDGGSTWISKDIGLPVNAYPEYMSFLSSEKGYLLGQSAYAYNYSYLYKTTDGAESWHRVGDSIYGLVNRMQFISQDTGFLIIGHKLILRTINGGINWDTVSKTFIYNTGDFTSGSDGISMAFPSKIYKTSDGSATWNLSTTHATVSNMMNLDFPSLLTGYAIGTSTSGSVIKTTDGGDTWFLLTDTLLNRHLYSCSFPDESMGYISGDSGIILRTRDGGVHWEKIYGNAPYNSSQVVFTSPEDGYALLTKNYSPRANDLIRTTDGGDNWTITDFVIDGMLTKICFPTPDTGYMVAAENSNTTDIYRTVNAGVSWDTLSPIPIGYVTNLYFLDGKTGFFSNDGFYMTKDGGETWVVQDSILDMSFYDLYFFDENNGIGVGTKGAIRKTADGGKTWTTIESGTNNNLYRICFPTRDSGFISGSYGTILSISNATHLGISEPLTLNKEPLSVFYPNPSTESASIRFSLQHDGKVKIVIYDLMGKEIKSIQDPSGNSGQHIVSFSTSEFPSGLYYYRLVAGDQLESGKFIRE